MRILLVHPATEMSIGDVARGYRAALDRRGHDICDYRLTQRFKYHIAAMPDEAKMDPALVSRMASENVLNEALYFEADVVLVVSGLNLHPIVLWSLGRIGIPVAVVFTESPYEDPDQTRWSDISHTGGSVDLTIFTNDLLSSNRYGWHYLPPAFDPAIHKPVEPNPETACDVMMIGSGWVERVSLLEGVNWDGIDVRLYGIWPTLQASNSPLITYYHPVIVDNRQAPAMYSSAKICINFDRFYPEALTPGPRVFETAACGAFQISDPRPEIERVFGDSIPTFRNASELSDLIRYYLDRPEDRKVLAARALDRVLQEDFDHRAVVLETVLLQQPQLIGRD